MKVIENYDLINEAGELKRLPAGPQICKIIEVVDKPDQEYLDVYFDISEGEFKGYFTALFENTSKNYGRITRSYKPNALPFFKQFITAVEKSNPGYKWIWDEKSLTNKTCVVNFREEEYLVDGSVKTMAKAYEIRSLEALKNGLIKTLPMKKLEVQPEQISPTVDLSGDDLPF